MRQAEAAEAEAEAEAQYSDAEHGDYYTEVHAQVQPLPRTYFFPNLSNTSYKPPVLVAPTNTSCGLLATDVTLFSSVSKSLRLHGDAT